MRARTLATRPTRLGVLAALSTLVVAGPLAAEPEAQPERLLRFNPFSRPDLGAPGASGQSGDRAASGAWQPVLTATLMAEDRGLANLGGVVLEVGESTHGWRLLEVREFEAVFEHGAERVVLPVEKAQGGTP